MRKKWASPSNHKLRGGGQEPQKSRKKPTRGHRASSASKYRVGSVREHYNKKLDIGILERERRGNIRRAHPTGLRTSVARSTNYETQTTKRIGSPMDRTEAEGMRGLLRPSAQFCSSRRRALPTHRLYQWASTECSTDSDHRLSTVSGLPVV